MNTIGEGSLIFCKLSLNGERGIGSNPTHRTSQHSIFGKFLISLSLVFLFVCFLIVKVKFNRLPHKIAVRIK